MAELLGPGRGTAVGGRPDLLEEIQDAGEPEAGRRSGWESFPHTACHLLYFFDPFGLLFSKYSIRSVWVGELKGWVAALAVGLWVGEEPMEVGCAGGRFT